MTVSAVFTRTDLNFNMYWDDNPEKLERFLRILDQSDYIAISSNRQWGTLPRIAGALPDDHHLLSEPDGLPERADSIEYCYRVAEPGIFQGNLGYDLVQVFTSEPTIGPISLNDQFAEEAFTVYDHPKVLIFKKSPSYNPSQGQAISWARSISPR